MAVIGMYAPPNFMQHFIVFVLAVFVGFQVIWGVAHSLHTPLMAVTNAISGIIIVGALLQLNTGNTIVTILAGISVLIATINIVGGFMVTRRMLADVQEILRRRRNNDFWDFRPPLISQHLCSLFCPLAVCQIRKVPSAPSGTASSVWLSLSSTIVGSNVALDQVLIGTIVDWVPLSVPLLPCALK